MKNQSGINQGFNPGRRCPGFKLPPPAIIISNAAYMKADIAFPLAGVVAVLALIRLQLGVLVEMFS